MKRLLGLVLCAATLMAIVSCGGAGDDASDKLTIVGSGS